MKRSHSRNVIPGIPGYSACLTTVDLMRCDLRFVCVFRYAVLADLPMPFGPRGALIAAIRLGGARRAVREGRGGDEGGQSYSGDERLHATSPQTTGQLLDRVRASGGRFGRRLRANPVIRNDGPL